MKYNYYKKLLKYKNKDIMLSDKLEKLTQMMFDNISLRFTVQDDNNSIYTIFTGDSGFIIQNNNCLSDYKVFYCFTDLCNYFNSLYFLRYDYDK